MSNTTCLATSSNPTKRIAVARSVPTNGAKAPAVPAIPDTELVSRFNNGDESAFVEIMTRYRSKIFVTAQNMLHNHADAEEITQDTFVRAYRGLARFRGDSSLSTWLHRIAANLAYNRYRYLFRRGKHSTVSLECPIGEEGNMTIADLISSGNPDPAHESSRDEFVGLVAAAMQKLNANDCEILALRNLKNHSYSEIAQFFSINLGTVKSRIARAREHLRLQLIEACPEFSADAAPSEWFEHSRESGRLVPAFA